MKTKSLQVFLVLCCLALSLSCEKEEHFIRSVESIKTVSQDQALDMMKQTQQRILAKSDANFITSISEEVNYEDLTNTDEELAVIPVTTQYSKLNSRLVLLTIDNKVQSAVVSLNPFEDSTPASFSGELLITDLEGDFIKGFRIEDNLLVTEYLNDQKAGKSSTDKNYTLSKSLVDCDTCPYSECSYCDIGSVDLGIIERNSPPTPYISITHMYPTGGGGDESNCEVGCDNSWNPVAGGGGSSTLNLDPEENDSEEDRIKNELDDPCAKNIFTQLEIGNLEQALKQAMNPETNIFITFHRSILKLFRGSDIIHLTIQNGNTGNSNAYTLGSDITIGNDYLNNATQLSIARTMIHETVHAYINAMYSNTIEFDSFSFREKLDKYAEDNGYTIGTNEFHHEFMSGYVDAIAISLFQWDTNYGTGGNLGWDYYQSMAWGGLFQVDINGNIVATTDAFRELVPDANDRQEIANILSNEQKGNSDAQGTECD